jgi:hypothetical protein
MVPFFNIVFELFLDDDTPTDDQIKESLNLTALINALMLATIVVAPSTFNYEEWILIDERFADGNYKVWRDSLFFKSSENLRVRVSLSFLVPVTSATESRPTDRMRAANLLWPRSSAGERGMHRLRRGVTGWSTCRGALQGAHDGVNGG